MAFGHVEHRPVIHKFIQKYLIHLGGPQLFVGVVGYALGGVAHRLFELGGQVEAVIFLQDIADAALARLAVDADDVRLVFPAHIRRVDGQIRHVPIAHVVLFAPLHALGDGVLMGAGEGREHERARIRLAGRHFHLRIFGIAGADLGHAREVELRVYPLREHVHAQSDHVYIARALAVAEQGALHPVRPRQKTHLRRGDAAAAVVMRVQAEHHVFAVFEVFGDVLALLGENVRHGVFDGGGDVDDRLAVCRGLPHVEHGVAHFQGVFGLGTRKTFGAVFKAVAFARLVGQLLQKFCPFHRDLQDGGLVLFEHLLALGDGGGVIHVHDDVFRPADGLEGAADDVLARLRQHLHGDVVGDEPLVDEGAHEHVLRFAGGGEADLDLFEADLDQELEEFHLLLQRHRLDERLVAVAKVYRAPHGGVVDGVFFRPVHAADGGHIILLCVLFKIFHIRLSPLFLLKNKPAFISKETKTGFAVPLFFAQALRALDKILALAAHIPPL